MAENLVALRERRHQVIARLSECFAGDVLEVDELERRLDLAHGARTVAELDHLVEDLAPASATALVPAAASPLAIDDPHRAATKKLRVVMSSIERKGRWSVPQRLDVRTFWGHVLLDFREASLAPGATTVDVRVTMANVEVILPPGLAVDVDVSSFAASVEERHRVPPDDDPARPLLRITGAIRFGSLSIETRLPGESRRDASRREKREKRERRALEGKPRALPPSSSK